MKLVDLVTMHPGGWQDIIDFVKKKMPDAVVDISSPVWSMTNVVVNRRGEELFTLVNRASRSSDYMSRYSLPDFLENVEYVCSGLLATEAVRVLLKVGLPVPGDKDWLKPSGKWKVGNA